MTQPLPRAQPAWSNTCQGITVLDSPVDRPGGRHQIPPECLQSRSSPDLSFAGQDGGDSDPESGSLEFDSEDIDELGFFVDSEMDLTSDDDFE